MGPRKRSRDWGAEDRPLSLTSLIDVTFLLLVFFLLTLQFRTLDGRLATYLPKDAGGRPRADEPSLDVTLVVRVVEPGRRTEPGAARAWDGEGRYDLRERVVSYAIGPQPTTDVSILGRDLTRLHASHPEWRLKISAGRSTIVSDIVTAVDVAIRAGYTDITFTGR